jgi:integrase
MKRKSPFPRYTNNFRDRHGRWRSYFRRGAACVALPEPLLGPEWWEAYRAALADYIAGREPGAQSKIGASRTKAGTVAAAFAIYAGSANFTTGLAESTRKAHFRLLRHWADEYGEHRIRHLQRKHVAQWVAEKVVAPASAREFLKSLRRMMAYLVEIGEIELDPTSGVRAPKLRTIEITTWDESQIAQYRRHHPIGSTPRLALELLLGTGQRRGDVVTLGRQHRRGDVLHLAQRKTGAVVDVPILLELAQVLDALPPTNLTYIVNQYGTPFTAEGFGEAFRQWCYAAGLPRGCTSHGLRKACARRLAEAGCTPHEIMSITGHRTLAEVERYTRAADRERLAHAAMAKAGTRNLQTEIGFVEQRE